MDCFWGRPDENLQLPEQPILGLQMAEPYNQVLCEFAAQAAADSNINVKEGVLMKETVPPWRSPAAECAASGRSRKQRCMANRRKLWGAKPEATGRLPYARSVAIGKPWETTGRQSQRLRGDPPYARSATGYFASEDTAKKGSLSHEEA